MNIQQLQERFKQANPRFGPLPFWWWSAEEVTPERIRWQLQKFRSGGLRNIGIINIAPTGPQYGSVGDRPAYFSEAWWNNFETALREAQRLGMYLYFYDQIGFSGSNFPAHIVTQHPEYTGYVLRRYKPQEKLPEDAQLLHESEGYRYASIRQGFDWLNAKATALLFDKVHGEFERRFPHDLGRTIAGSFQDELPPLPLWTGELPEKYAERHGEDLLPQLPALFDSLPSSDTVRCRVYELAAELAEESVFIPLAKWHDQYGMLICCDQAGPARRVDVHGAQRLYLDYFRTHRWYNAAGSDMDGEIKPHASMVHLNGGKRVFLEAFHTSGWGGTVEETLHWLIPWLQAGATLYSPHSVYFSTRGGWWEWAPPDTGWRQPYYEHYQVFADTISRACSLLSEGTHVADIAVHYPSHAACGYMSLDDGGSSEHPMAVSSRMPNERMNHLHEVYRSLTGRWSRREQRCHGALREARLDYDIVDDSALERGQLEGTKLRIADERFTVLLLCGTTIMDEAARSSVQAWIEAGGRVIGVSVPEAERAQGLEGVIYTETAEDAVRLIEGIVPRRIEGQGMTLQRRTADADVYLLLPDNGSLLLMHEPAGEQMKLQESAIYRLRTAGSPQLWDPVSGRCSELPHQRDGEWVEVEVRFTEWPAALVVCPDPAAASGMKEQRESSSLRVLPEAASRELPQDGWRVLAVPTLDNRYGDFDLHGEPTQFLPIERREVLIRREQEESAGEVEGWHLPECDDQSGSGWTKRLWSEADYWLACKGERFEAEQAWPVVYSDIFGDLSFRTWAGRMGRVPRRFLNLGEALPEEKVWARSNVLAPAEGKYWIRIESNAKVTGSVNGTAIDWQGGPEELTGWAWLQEGANALLLCAEAIVSGLIRAGVEVNAQAHGTLPKWIYASQPNGNSRLSKLIAVASDAQVQSVRMVFAARGRVALFVNGASVTEHGDFNPYIRQGQEEVDVTALWRSGENEVKFMLPEGAGEVLADIRIECDGGKTLTIGTDDTWLDDKGEQALVLHEAVLQFAETETLWLSERPHPLPNVGWLMPGSVPVSKPLPFQHAPERLGLPVWLRFPLPVGATQLQLDCEGEARIWIAGSEVALRDGVAQFAPQPAGAIAAVRVVPHGFRTGADVLRAPIRFKTAPSVGKLGDWRSALCLPHHSGVVEYEITIQLSESDRLLELGHVRGTAEVWLDGLPLGIRAWRPYRFELPKELAQGAHRLRVRVTNTLGTHYEIGRPSSNVGGNANIAYWGGEQNSEWPNLFASGGLYGPVRIIGKSESIGGSERQSDGRGEL